MPQRAESENGFTSEKHLSILDADSNVRVTFQTAQEHKYYIKDLIYDPEIPSDAPEIWKATLQTAQIGLRFSRGWFSGA